jgi:hypothetical protein
MTDRTGDRGCGELNLEYPVTGTPAFEDFFHGLPRPYSDT